MHVTGSTVEMSFHLEMIVRLRNVIVTIEFYIDIHVTVT